MFVIQNNHFRGQALANAFYRDPAIYERDIDRINASDAGVTAELDEDALSVWDTVEFEKLFGYLFFGFHVFLPEGC